MFNSGFRELARQQAKHTIRVFEGCGPVVMPSGSCAAMIKVEYPRLLDDDPSWRRRASELASRTFELSDFLVNQLNVCDVGARFRGKVAYHYSCHLRMLGQTDEAERLIRRVQGAVCVPLVRHDQCCGFGGSFAVRYPQISGAMADDKAACIMRSGAAAVVCTDAGCLMNIGGRLHREGRAIETLHIAELLERR
jgi:L-lactate dehydrogenase complex protein LldE